MALRIRLRRMGRKKAPHYRIVVAESSMPRDGRFVATIGHYNPRTEPVTLVVDQDKARSWMKTGAKPTDTVHSLFGRAGVYREPGMVEAVVDIAKSVASRAGSAASQSAAVAGSTVASVVETVRETASAAAEQVQDAVTAAVERVTGGEDAAADETAAGAT
ncbi:MAG: 30S ribosomal protein S16, partial [Gemmatimonadetes bacterium]|nr:30S ribosomal protein S16 [Gemmatimonadota bacterium]